MALPAFDATKHDVGINGVGYMLASGQKQDLRPGTTRASSGEGRFDSFESESFHAQSEFGGGRWGNVALLLHRLDHLRAEHIHRRYHRHGNDRGADDGNRVRQARRQWERPRLLGTGCQWNEEALSLRRRQRAD